MKTFTHSLKASFILLLTAVLLVTDAYAQSGNYIKIDYSHPSTWTVINTGGNGGYIKIAGNKVRFINAPNGCGGNNIEIRAYKAIPGGALNNTAWSSTFQFVFYGNDPSDTLNNVNQTNGTGAEVLCFSADSLNPHAPVCGNLETNNSWLEVGFRSSSSGSMSNYGLTVSDKDTTAICGGSRIDFSAVDNYQTFYCKFERLNATLIRLSVFTDTAMTINKAGSPIYVCIPASISNLKYIQHCTANVLASQRVFSGTVGNVEINNNATPLSIQCGYATVNKQIKMWATPTVPVTGLTFTWSPSTALSVTTGDTVYANPTLSTTYTVALDPATSANTTNCSDSCTILKCSTVVYPEGTVNVTANDNISIAAFPNPVNDVLTIKLTGLPRNTYSMIMYDGIGNEVKEVFIGRKIDQTVAIHIDMHNIPAGMYNIRLMNGSLNKCINIIKQ